MPRSRPGIGMGSMRARIREEYRSLRFASGAPPRSRGARHEPRGLMEDVVGKTADSAAPRSRTTEKRLFASNFLRHPFMLGSIIPSSRHLVNRVLEPIDWATARVIVEYGPGVG